MMHVKQIKFTMSVSRCFALFQKYFPLSHFRSFVDVPLITEFKDYGMLTFARLNHLVYTRTTCEDKSNNQFERILVSVHNASINFFSVELIFNPRV